MRDKSAENLPLRGTNLSKVSLIEGFFVSLSLNSPQTEAAACHPLASGPI